jgi:hypothetical protein
MPMAVVSAVTHFTGPGVERRVTRQRARPALFKLKVLNEKARPDLSRARVLSPRRNLCGSTFLIRYSSLSKYDVALEQRQYGNELVTFRMSGQSRLCSLNTEVG